MKTPAFRPHATPWRALIVTLSAAALLVPLSGCAPLVAGAAVGGTVLVATDRRTTGAQVEDQAIELKAANRLREQLGERARISVTSFNRRVLLTGEVASEADRQTALRIVQGVDNVAGLVDELAVMGSPSLTARSADALVTARVKAAFVDAADLQANAFKVVTERGTVYLMGLVTKREADRASEIARAVPGVQRVVRVFEYLSEADLARLQPAKPTGESAAPSR
ncbi:BON domain-containing protein [Tepidimonas taiwanensis]|uniref:Osmotically-inducible protein Y n=1 Tax=Tepidimonas taiwanensis TaxID=307486 RepID=A0A554XAD5_9BURK|nr:BON domain-containing protein [Tepidimonas taiwanensis]MCX7693092.1 BON domain-containing protein [Tepidimonas taiwanensis]MDM7462863.1 BON domain-containing protein [Tepidimonas taiwanensis]TSE32800.1 Osmotically-inducible protein Y [Tepidimonas taiwanensis]UBQ05622.1 BON domain-containing protein [Tepidimonas taiwanensis]